MARSYIDPSLVALATQPAAPPWNWNPGATFVEAYNESQRTKMAREKMELDNWMTQTLFPYKQAQAQLELQKLQQDVEFRSLAMKKVGEYDRERHANRMKVLQNTPTTGRTRSAGLFNQLSASEEAAMTAKNDESIMLPED